MASFPSWAAAEGLTSSALTLSRTTSMIAGRGAPALPNAQPAAPHRPLRPAVQLLLALPPPPRAIVCAALARPSSHSWLQSGSPGKSPTRPESCGIKRKGCLGPLTQHTSPAQGQGAMPASPQFRGWACPLPMGQKQAGRLRRVRLWPKVKQREWSRSDYNPGSPSGS